MIKDFLISVLSVPISDLEITKDLFDRDLTWQMDRLEKWLNDVKDANNRFEFKLLTRIPQKPITSIELTKPYKSNIHFRFISGEEMNSTIDLYKSLKKEIDSYKPDFTIFLVVSETKSQKGQKNFIEFEDLIQSISDNILIIEPEWAAAFLVEGLKPIAGLANDKLNFTSYFDHFDSKKDVITIRRTEERLQFLIESSTDSVTPIQKKNTYTGTTLLCTTFLPPVTYSVNALQRFYKNVGVTDTTLKAIIDRSKREFENWCDSVSKQRRYDIIDRNQLIEYFNVPDYYQMILTRDEVDEQIDNLKKLLNYENYSLCLTPEAVDIAFEIQKPKIRIRPDRRNRAIPRPGRISKIEINDEAISEIFEKEFWNKFRLTEPEFKEKQFLKGWIDDLLANLESPHRKNANSEYFDVFLCHNTKDKDEVKKIGESLIAKGIKPWLDEWNIAPGRPWQSTLQSQIKTIKSAAVFIGESGIGPWASFELEAFIMEFVNRGCPVIPVLLPNINTVPELPIFLKRMHYVDFSKETPDPLSQLIWGITDKKPK